MYDSLVLEGDERTAEILWSEAISDLQSDQEIVLSLKGSGYTNIKPSVSNHIKAKAAVLGRSDMV